MRIDTLRACLPLFLACGWQLVGADLSVKADRLVTEAKKVQLEAMDISKALRPKNPEFAKIQTMMEALEKHVENVDGLVKEMASDETGMTAAQKSKYEAVKMKSELLAVFAKNKKDMLLGTDPGKNRGLLRAKADGIAKRAEMLQQTAITMRR